MRVVKEERQEPRRLEKKKEKRGKEKRRKKINETETVKRRCEGFVSGEAFEIFSLGRTPWRTLRSYSCAHVRVVPAVADVPVHLLRW